MSYKKYIPKQIIIENPDLLDLDRFNMDLVRSDAIHAKNNSFCKEWQVAISEKTEALSSNRTRTYYEWHSNGEVEIATQIKKDTMLITVNLLKSPKYNESKVIGEWKTIDLAPKDGTFVLAYIDGLGIRICGYYKDVEAWAEYNPFEEGFLYPTHFQLLPTPPIINNPAGK